MTVDTDFYGLSFMNYTQSDYSMPLDWFQQVTTANVQLCLHRPGISLCSCSIFAPKVEISPKLATHEGLVMYCVSFYFHGISVLAF